VTGEAEHGVLNGGEIRAQSAGPAVSSPGQASVETLGLVVGTVPATPLQFWVGLAPGQYVQLDDVLVTQRELPGQPGVQIAGVVTNVEAMHEGARFASDVFLIEQGALPAEVCEVAEVAVTRVEPELYVPPLPGAQVRRAVGAQRESALYFDEMGASRVPVGFGRDAIAAITARPNLPFDHARSAVRMPNMSRIVHRDVSGTTPTSHSPRRSWRRDRCILRSAVGVDGTARRSPPHPLLTPF